MVDSLKGKKSPYSEHAVFLAHSLLYFAAPSICYVIYCNSLLSGSPLNAVKRNALTHTAERVFLKIKRIYQFILILFFCFQTATLLVCS